MVATGAAMHVGSAGGSGPAKTGCVCCTIL